LEEIVAAPVKKTENMTGGIRCADHPTPSLRKSWYYFAKKRRSLGRYSSLADQSHEFFFLWGHTEFGQHKGHVTRWHRRVSERTKPLTRLILTGVKNVSNKICREEQHTTFYAQDTLYLSLMVFKSYYRMYTFPNLFDPPTLYTSQYGREP
jgi:hypothetical protein